MRIGVLTKESTLILFNNGSEDFEYTVTTGNESWLTLAGEIEGILSPADSASVGLQFNILDLETDIYYDTLEVLSIDSKIPSISVPVELHLISRSIRIPEDFSMIQTGIDASLDGDTVLVSGGTYAGEGNKDLDYGGKAITVKSLEGPESTVIDCEFDGKGVYFQSGEDTLSRLEGFTIKNGYSYYGSGIHCYSSSPSIKDCIFNYNGYGFGGAICCEEGSSPLIEECILSNNSVFGYGGGLFVMDGSPILVECIFTENTAGYRGGGLDCFKSSMVINNCMITGNIASNLGGGFFCYAYSSPTITNSIFAENSAGVVGGGFYFYNSDPAITNCTITGNTAGVQGGGVFQENFSSSIITNTILWNDFPEEVFVEMPGNVDITFSNIDGGWTGEGNIDADPRFVKFHGFKYLLNPVSPCIDTGDPVIEDGLYDWHPRWPDWYPDGARSDMGAYGGPGNWNWLR